ncbi:MAG: polysaccharide deacetylase family protein [Lachnospiraceae bacterium]|nr:polysaccharide deacetylase family protein [Lachnospiraceae bacterium]
MRRWRSVLTALILCGACVELSGKRLLKRDIDGRTATILLTTATSENTWTTFEAESRSIGSATNSTDTVDPHAQESSTEISAGTETKRIALTFDDGPHPVCTPLMLEVLVRENVPATFFLLGENVELYGDIVKEIAARGHLIGNHTWHHVQITTLPLEEARAEILETSELIEELTGQGTEYVRPPFGT